MIRHNKIRYDEILNDTMRYVPDTIGHDTTQYKILLKHEQPRKLGEQLLSA